MQKRTKIVATIGPASEQVTKLTRMIRAGLNVARLNFSHGTHAYHARLIRRVRQAARAVGEPVAILQDLSGPKIRVGDIPKEGTALIEGKEVLLTSRNIFTKGSMPTIPVSHPRLERDVRKGEHILLDDGLLELTVVGVSKQGVRCRVVVGGVLLPHKGVNLPQTKLTISSITKKDRADLAFGLAHGVDFVALSFVREARDVRELRGIIKKGWRGADPPKIVVKIEKPQALEHFDEILRATDAVMVARGDLAVETPAEKVPVWQKTIIERCRAARKPVIVATEMLGSMVARPRPTRAEVSDVANAVEDHTDAVMLSGETATGKYPVEAVKTMAHIIEEMEKSPFDNIHPEEATHTSVSGLALLTDIVGHRGDVGALLLGPEAYDAAPSIVALRAEVPVIVGCASERAARQLNLLWSVRPIPHAFKNDAAFISAAKKFAVRRGLSAQRPVALVKKNRKQFEIIVAPL